MSVYNIFMYQTSYLEQTGGTLNVTNFFGLATDPDTTSAFSISGGTFSSTNTDTGNVSAFWLGQSGTATLNISGAAIVNVADTTQGLRLGQNSGSSGTVNLNGGTLSTTMVTQGSGSGTFNFNGGTLEAGQSTTTFMQGLTNAYVLAGGGTINNNGNNITIGQALLSSVSNDGGLTFNGSGTTILTGANTYVGGTTLSAGTLVVGGAANSALGTGALALNGGTLSSTNDGGANYDPTITNAITAGGGNIAAGNGTGFHVNGNISGSGALGVSGIFNGAGLTLGGNNSGYTGTVTVTAANTRLDSTSAGSANAAWVVNGNLQTDVVGGGTFQLGSLSGNGTIDGHAANGSLAVSTLSVGALGTSGTFSGTILDQALNDSATGNTDTAANNQVALTKVGAGILTLTGSNTYTGATNVTGGTLIIGGPLAETGSLSVSGGTVEFAANDTVNHAAHVTLSAGALQILANETETLSDLTLGSGASALTLGATGSVVNFADSLANAGNWTGTLAISDWNGASLGGGSDEVFIGTSNDLTTAQLADITFVNGTVDGTPYATASAVQLATGEIVASAVPEPSTWAMLAGSIGMLGICRRLRRKHQS